MDEVSRTHDTYEGNSVDFVEKYCEMSVAEEYGDPFFEALDGAIDGTSGTVLDIGCGPGPDVETFADAGHDVVGFDITASFLREAAERVPDAAFARGDMRHLPFADGTFDGLWASASFHHVPREQAAETLREFRRVLRDGGPALVSVKRARVESTEDPDRHFEYYRPDAFRSLLETAGFDPVELNTEERWVWTVATC